MTKTIWETRSCPYDTRAIEMRIRETCNKLGEEGWEPFHIEPDTYELQVARTGTIWFKRPKQQEEG